MKKTIVLILTLCMLLTAFAGCGKTVDPATTAPTNPAAEKTLKIVCTVFPQYDWVCNILGDRLQDTELTLLLDSGVDLHSYEPLPEDLIALAKCDLFIYIGGESDEKWAPDTIETTGVKNAMNLLEALGDAAKEEAEVAGMQEEEEEEEEGALDEHIWLSLKNAVILCGAICDKLCEIDPAYADIYKANAEAYIGELSALDVSFAEVIAAAKYSAILVADRFPFRYLCEDYGITPYAAFSGCSTECQASMGTIATLAGYLDELGMNTVLVTESSDRSTAQAVINSSNNKDCGIAALDSMQGVTASRVQEGATYLNIMRENLTVLQGALNN
ncbi:MAG: zinc ABC transporter substrate-binding protein [Clostridia bacterium]|nr:zinc ABC transporter substrate-binding protein [Clostridia bacterium]